MEVFLCIFCKETGKQNIKQLSEKRLTSVKSASERRQNNFFDTIEQLKRDGLVIAFHCLPSLLYLNAYIQN